MLRYLGGRLVRLLGVFVLVSLATMFMVSLVPGDPAITVAGEAASPEVLDAVNERYGFDDPVPERYVNWLGGLVTGDFGSSYLTKQPVWEMITARLPVTFQLVAMAMGFALLAGIVLAIVAAQRPDGLFDRAVGAATSAVISVPSFVLALFLVYVFAIRLRWLPVTGWVPFSESVVDNLRSAILPAASLAAIQTVILQRVLRAEMIQTYKEEFITVARARGLSPARVAFRHALRPSSFSLVTIAGLILGRLIGGTVVVEIVFALPGIGRLLVSSIQSKDIIVVQGIVMFFACVYIVINLIVDLLYPLLDPRVRTSA